jgi:hypothetical protein
MWTVIVCARHPVVAKMGDVTRAAKQLNLTHEDPWSDRHYSRTVHDYVG